ncbi:MAG: protoporphyrinogen oxidase [Planctomycetota bacterium]
MVETVQTVIVGAGIWGLACGRQLLKQIPRDSLLILDCQGRAGGKLNTVSFAGFHFETAANGFLDSNPATLNLCRDLGLANSLVRASGTASRNRYVYLRGKFQRLPSSLWGILTTRLLSWNARWRIATERFRRPSIPSCDESISEFGRRRLGPELTDTLLNAFVTGIWGGDAEKLSLRSCFPKWHEWESQYGSITGGIVARRKERITAARSRGEQPPGPPQMWSLTGGLNELMSALSRECVDRLRLNAGVAEIRFHDHRIPKWDVVLDNGKIIQAKNVVLANPPDKQAEILIRLDDELASEINQIPSNSISVVVLGFETQRLPQGLEGFGYLTPYRDGRPVLGVQWCSEIFPGLRAPPGKSIWRALVRGGSQIDSGGGESSLIQSVMRELKIVLGIESEPIFTSVIHWPRAIPQYVVGHADRIRRISTIAARWPGLFLGGSGYQGVAINDCVDQAQLLANKIAS